MGLKIAALGLGLVNAMLLTRLLGPADFGLYALGLSVMTLMAVVVNFGLPTLATREIAARGADGPATLRSRAPAMAAMTALLAALGAGALALAAPVALPEGLRPALPLVLALIALHAATKLAAGQLRGLGHVVAAQLPELLIRPALLTLLLAGAVAAGQRLSLGGALSLYALAGAAGLAVAAVALWRGARAGPTTPPAPGSPALLRAGFPLMLSGAVVVINQNVDLLVLSAFAPPEDLGTYRVAARLAALVGVGLAAVGAVSAPVLARRHGAGDRPGLEAEVRAAAARSLILALPIAAIFLAAPGPVLGLAFGAHYAGGAIVLVILTLGQLVNAGFGILGVVLNMTGLERYTIAGVSAACALNLGLTLALVPGFGILGAALAQGASLLAWNALLGWFLWRRLGIVALPFLPARPKAATGT